MSDNKKPEVVKVKLEVGKPTHVTCQGPTIIMVEGIEVKSHNELVSSGTYVVGEVKANVFRMKSGKYVKIGVQSFVDIDKTGG